MQTWSLHVGVAVFELFNYLLIYTHQYISIRHVNLQVHMYKTDQTHKCTVHFLYSLSLWARIITSCCDIWCLKLLYCSLLKLSLSLSLSEQESSPHVVTSDACSYKSWSRSQLLSERLLIWILVKVEDT